MIVIKAILFQSIYRLLFISLYVYFSIHMIYIIQKQQLHGFDEGHPFSKHIFTLCIYLCYYVLSSNYMIYIIQKQQWHDFVNMSRSGSGQPTRGSLHQRSTPAKSYQVVKIDTHKR